MPDRQLILPLVPPPNAVETFMGPVERQIWQNGGEIPFSSYGEAVALLRETYGLSEPSTPAPTVIWDDWE